MNKYIILLVLIAISCKGQIEKNNRSKKAKSEIIETANFKLIKAKNQRGLLILFPCFRCDAVNTLTEFKITEIGVKNDFSILAMNFNQHLYLTEIEKQELANPLTQIVRKYDLSEKNIFFGGFSSGGNVSLLMCDYLIENKNKIQPKGIFIVDSPIDLLGLYKTAQKNNKMNFSKTFTQESMWIKSFFDNTFGNPNTGIHKYEKYSPYTLETQNIENLKNLKNIKIRFYTEPDIKWWQENRNTDYKDLNAYYLKKLSDQIKTELENKNIDLIETKNQGYHANGKRHPHSWSIVNVNDLINWMLE